MYKLTSEPEQSLCSTTRLACSQEEVAFAFAIPGGKRPKEKQCFSVSLPASTTCWLPGAPQTAARIVIGTQPARCYGGSPERLPFQVSLRTERPCPLPPLGNWPCGRGMG